MSKEMTLIERVEQLKRKEEIRRLIGCRVLPQVDLSLRSVAELLDVPYTSLASTLIETGLEQLCADLRDSGQVQADVLTPSEFLNVAEQTGISVNDIHYPCTQEEA